MNDSTTIPHVGQVLRAVLTTTGLRRLLTDTGRDKDLDDAANEAREGSTCNLIKDIEDVCAGALANDVGQRWADFLLQAWAAARRGVQRFASDADVSLLDPAQAADEVRRSFIVPLASAFLAHAFRQAVAPDLETWWRSPFAAWRDLAAARTGCDQAEVLVRIGNHLEVDTRTIERWITGLPSKELCWPFLPIVRSALADAKSTKEHAANCQSEAVQHNLAAWLMLSVAFQAQQPDLRDAVRRRFQVGDLHLWSVRHAIDAVNCRAIATCARPTRETAMKVLLEAEALFSYRPFGLLLVSKTPC